MTRRYLALMIAPVSPSNGRTVEQHALADHGRRGIERDTTAIHLARPRRVRSLRLANPHAISDDSATRTHQPCRLRLPRAQAQLAQYRGAL